MRIQEVLNPGQWRTRLRKGCPLEPPRREKPGYWNNDLVRACTDAHRNHVPEPLGGMCAFSADAGSFPQTFLGPGIATTATRTRPGRSHRASWFRTSLHPVCGFCSGHNRPTHQGRGCAADLIEALPRLSGDLETALPGWLPEGIPWGIETVTENWRRPRNGGRHGRLEASGLYERNGFPSFRHKTGFR